jgi:DNA-binding transcriptional regulator GbsR (MarR family)
LARLGLVRRSSKLADRRDFYEAETDFYKSIRSILKERQNTEFDEAVRSVRETLQKLETGQVSGDEAEKQFILERVRALQDFFDALDSLTRAVSKLDGLGLSTVQKVLSILR